MKKLMLSAIFAIGLVAGVEAAPESKATVSQEDFRILMERFNQLAAENKALAKRVAELEDQDKQFAKWQKAQDYKVSEQGKSLETLPQRFNQICSQRAATEEGTTTNASGRVYTTEKGWKYYLADKSAKIFEPLSESGLKVTPYGYLLFEGVYSTRDLDADWSADFVKRNAQKRNETTLSMQDSIFGLQFDTPEAVNGWTFTGRAEFDLAGGNQNDYKFHWRHVYVNAEHESGWSILFGQTWHLWKIVSPSEIDGAWMENAGHPYRRSPQIRVTKKWDFEDSSFEARAGIVKGGPGMGGDRDSDNIEDNTASPWVLFEGALVYDHDAAWQDDNKRWLIGLGGMYGRDRSHRATGYNRVFDETDGWINDSLKYGGDEDDYDSMMGLVALSVPMGQFTLTGQFYGGENLGGVQAGCGQRISFHSLNARGNEVRAIGGFVDLGYQLNDDWSFAIGWGCDDPINDDVEGAIDGNNSVIYNDRAYICAFYQVMSNFKLGLEYARLLTSYSNTPGAQDGGDFDADRVQFSAFYDF